VYAARKHANLTNSKNRTARHNKDALLVGLKLY